MALNAFDTTICKHYKVDKIILEIKKSNSLGEIVNFDPYPLKPGIMAITAAAKDVPPFTHPLTYDGLNIAIDVRGYTTLHADGTLKINANSVDEFKFHYLRALLQLYANGNNNDCVGKLNDLRKLSYFPATVYSNWIGRAIAQRLSLEPEAQMRTTVLAAMFYYSLFMDSKELLRMDESDRNSMANWIERVTSVSINEIIKITEVASPMQDLDALVENLKDHGGSIRFDKLNKGLLVSMLSFGWFGNNSSEILTVAIEHPITWIAIIERALNARGYMSSSISKLVEFYNKHDTGKNFLKVLATSPALEGASY